MKNLKITHLTDKSFKPAISHGGEIKLLGKKTSILIEIIQNVSHSDEKIVYIELDKSAKSQSYKDLFLEAQIILSGLRKLGLQPQDKVILQIESYQDFITAFWGCILGGFVPVPVANISYAPEQVNKTVDKLYSALQMLEKPLLLTDESFVAEMPNIPQLLQLGKFPVRTVAQLRESQPDSNFYYPQPKDTAVLMLTSGSTSAPKAVVLTHENLLSQIIGSVEMNGFMKKDITLNWVPIDHVAGLVYFHLRDVYLGSKQIHFPFKLFLDEPLVWLDLIERFKVNIIFGPNFAYGLINDCAEIIAQRQWDLSSIKICLNGAEAIIAKTARRFLQILKPHGLSASVMRPSWGMAEVSSGVTFADNFSLNSTTDDDLFVEVGKPIPGVNLRIVNEKNQIVQEGEIGQLQVKGLTVTSGYYQNPQANQQAFAEDGWFNTRDLGLIKNGSLTITGRQKDIIIIWGVNYYSHDIEAAVEEIAGVEITYTAACAVRKPHSNTDGLAVFFSAIETEDNSLKLLMEKIQKTIVQRIRVNPDYLIPVAKETIPKTAIGKIQRQELRRRFEAGQFNHILKL